MTIAAVPACIFTSSSGSKPATGTGPAVTDHRGDAPETRDHRGDDTGTAGTPTPDGGDTGTPVVMTNPPPPDRGGTATTTTGGTGSPKGDKVADGPTTNKLPDKTGTTTTGSPKGDKVAGGPSQNAEPADASKNPYRSWTIHMAKDGTCKAAFDSSCPANATCNPPPPTKIACPDGISVDRPLSIYSPAGSDLCYVTPPSAQCPKNATCNPPPPRKTACP